MQKFKERFDTLSDAILAIAMTILVYTEHRFIYC